MAQSKGKRKVPAIAPSPHNSSSNQGILARLRSSVVDFCNFKGSSSALYNGRSLLHGAGRAAWIAGTTFLILVVPLIIEMDREAQLAELEGHQASLLGGPPAPPPGLPSASL